jgi:hypothetical protein
MEDQMQLCVYPYTDWAPKFTVVRQAICATKMGFAGYVEVQTPDGTLIQVVGRYDNEYEQTETEMAHVAEHIWVNGDYYKPDDGESGTTIETPSGEYNSEAIMAAVCRALKLDGPGLVEGVSK